jgi:RNA polymerase sigma-70 factor (ECF subfamily)
MAGPLFAVMIPSWVQSHWIANCAVRSTRDTKTILFRWLAATALSYDVLMPPSRSEDSSETNRLLQLAASGDGTSLGKLLTRHETRLRRMVAFRLDPRLRGRVDSSDVMQEINIAASTHIGEYLARAPIPLFMWLRGIAANKLLEIRRHHLGTPMRDARRETATDRGPFSEATSAAIAAELSAHATRPSEAAIRAEAKRQLEDALDAMDPLDREVLALRHFEQLTNAETAGVLGINPAAAGKRYLRALERLRDILRRTPGGMEI